MRDVKMDAQLGVESMQGCGQYVHFRGLRSPLWERRTYASRSESEEGLSPQGDMQSRATMGVM